MEKKKRSDFPATKQGGSKAPNKGFLDGDQLEWEAARRKKKSNFTPPKKKKKKSR